MLGCNFIINKDRQIKKMNEFPPQKICSFTVVSANEPKYSGSASLARTFTWFQILRTQNLSESFFSERYLEIDTPYAWPPR